MWERPTPIPFTILPLNHPFVPVFFLSPPSSSSSLYPPVVHKDSALSCQMKLPKPGSHHLDNHFLLFAFYVNLIIFHLRQDGNHKLHCVPYAFAEIKHAARITESANGEICYNIFNFWTQHTEALQCATCQYHFKEKPLSSAWLNICLKCIVLITILFITDSSVNIFFFN